MSTCPSRGKFIHAGGFDRDKKGSPRICNFECSELDQVKLEIEVKDEEEAVEDEEVAVRLIDVRIEATGECTLAKILIDVEGVERTQPLAPFLCDFAIDN